MVGIRTMAVIAVPVATVLGAGGCSSGSSATAGSHGAVPVGPRSGTGAAGSAGGAPSVGGPSSGAGAAGDLPCDVAALLAANCQGCHGATPSYGAPMPLVTRADLLSASRSDPSQRVVDLVARRIHLDSNPMPPAPRARLSLADSGLLDAWIAAGAPAAAASCAPADGGSPDAGGGVGPEALPCEPDTFIHPSAAYAVGPDSDQYVCYGFDVTQSDKRHVIALSPAIDNKAVVHHLLLYRVAEAVPSTPAPCAYGGGKGELVTGWAPGVGNLILPPEAGYPEEGTTHWMMQIHYNNARGLSNQTDASGYKLCTTDKLRPNDAGVLAFGSVRFSIPPRSSLNLQCDYTYAGPTLHTFSAQPHMHLHGRSMSTLNVTRGQTLVDYPNFDFQSQYIHPSFFDIQSGDVIRNTCGWTNDSDSVVSVGETTEDEMCFDFVSYYPRVEQAGWSWVTPSVKSTCVNK